MGISTERLSDGKSLRHFNPSASRCQLGQCSEAPSECDPTFSNADARE